MIRKKKDRGTTEYVDPEMLVNPEPEEKNEKDSGLKEEKEPDDPGPELEEPVLGPEESDKPNEPEAGAQGGNESAADEFKAGFEAWADGRFEDDALRERLALTIDTIVEAVTGGKSDEALFELIAKGADYDRALAEAVEAAETRGRNARIEELMIHEEDGDGVPHPGTGCGGMGGSRTPSIFELARGAY